MHNALRKSVLPIMILVVTAAAVAQKPKAGMPPVPAPIRLQMPADCF